MKKIIAVLLCLSLGASLCACKKQAEEAPAREESAGTGYGTGKTSAIIEQDLYFLRPGSKRSDVEAALGSPQTFVLAGVDSCSYRLADGEELVLTYNKNDKVDTAEYTDAEGKRWDLFAFLDAKGIMVNYGSDTPLEEQPIVLPDAEETPEVQTPETGMPSDIYYYFSIQRYSYEMAEQILEAGALRETVLSALGKPNAYSSVDFKADGYIIDVYYMDDGSTLYLDFGYAREKLRAVRKVKSGVASEYLGKWGAEEKPEGLYRGDRTRYLFNALAKGQKPSEIYRRYGAPDWLEGSSRSYRDAYALQDGSVLYLDFGSGHSTLTAASIKKADGGIVVIDLR